MSRLRALAAAIPPWVAVAWVTAAFALVGWSGIEQWRNSGGDDAFEYRDYVERLDRTGHLPPKAENYEYSLPPGAPYVGVLVTRAFHPIVPDRPSPPLQGLPRLLRRLLWLALVVAGSLLMLRARLLSFRWSLGVLSLATAATFTWIYVDTAVNNERWLPLILVTYTAALGLVPATAFLARQVWPRARAAPVVGALAVLLLPSVFMAGLFFHPDPVFALIAVLATGLALRALRTGLTVPAGIGLGVTLGAAALVRQSLPVVAVAVGLGVLLVARRSSLRFLVAAAASLLAVAGPWWVIQTMRFGNPILSNLNRPGYMLDHEPLSFFVSFPAALVTHPYTPSFANQLLPRFHAYLWSDWGGQYHHWGHTKRFATLLASTQSVLGFGGDALVLGGVFLLGVPALVRVARRRGAAIDAPLAVLTTLFLLAWVGFVTMLVRFPQRGGDPIKAHYLLFLAPVSVVFGLAAARAFARRGRPQRTLLAAWLAAYVISWTLTVATAF